MTISLLVQDQLLVDLYGCEHPPLDLRQPEMERCARYPIEPMSPCPEYLLLAVWRTRCSVPAPARRYLPLPALRQLEKRGLIRRSKRPLLPNAAHKATLHNLHALRDGHCLAHTIEPVSTPPPIGLQALTTVDPTASAGAAKLAYVDLLESPCRFWKLTRSGISEVRRLIEAGDPAVLGATRPTNDGTTGGSPEPAAANSGAGAADTKQGGGGRETAELPEWSASMTKSEIADAVGFGLTQDKRKRIGYRSFDRAYGKKIKRINGTYQYRVNLTALTREEADKIRKWKRQ